jgi:hypothetical protein
VGYDIEFVQVAVEKGTSFPVAADAAGKLLKKTVPFKEPAAVTQFLAGLEGAKPGPAGAIDYLAKGLSYARFTVQTDRVHVENNLNCPELLRVYEKLRARYPAMLILDVQSGQLHDAASYKEWWSKPL